MAVTARASVPYCSCSESGLVRVLRMHPCSDVLLAHVGKGAHVGELSALLETPRGATVQALTEVVVIEISPAQIRELIRTEPEFARTITENLVERAGLSSTAAAAVIDGSERRAKLPARLAAAEE